MRPDADLFVRPDASRFMPSGAPRFYGKAAVRYFWPEPDRDRSRQHLEDQRLSEGDELALLAARETMRRLRTDLAAVQAELKFRRLLRKAGFDPGQPRAPAGSSEGGQWIAEDNQNDARLSDPIILSDAVPNNGWKPHSSYAQSRGRGSISVRIGGRQIEVEGGQAARLVEAQARAASAIARVRELDPSWRSTPSAYESIEGLISTYNADAEQAQARASELARFGIGPGPFAGDSISARGPGRNFTPHERMELNRIGSETGCHTCGITNPGTSSGNFVADHQLPSALNSLGRSQRLYPQCLTCSLRQGGWITSRGARR
jgi:hypothetical protein